MDFVGSRALALLLTLFILAGCVARPTATVLQPLQAPVRPTQEISILAVTNRLQAGDGGFTAIRSNEPTYERYTISVPPKRQAAGVNFVGRRPDLSSEYVVVSRERLSRSTFLQAVQQGLTPGGASGIYVHGYNQTFQEALFRLAQVTADAGVKEPTILFSWPSEASLLGYMADRDASIASRGDLVELIDLLAAQPRIKQINIAAHSMGAFLVMEAARQLKLSNKSIPLRKLGIILAAPDIDTDVFSSQMEIIGRPEKPMLILVSKNDRALAASSALGSERPRVGMLDGNDPFLRNLIDLYGLSIVDISSVQAPDAFGHEGFATLAALASNVTTLEANRNTALTQAGLFVVDATKSSLTAVRFQQ
ncbi:hypothetical protein GCM10007913_33700 [Devosia yakushimensis]|uniref:Esterase/lipase superfamily enzyme n=1 Tax=Devosia yakushimensis TaxID=470028 RepID=A0ABQ5UHA1_9HYPH|nr:alpha/beta hydrolase [Devosia yakushimensis]GLQ11438.1 hypothetical protein GCM10007913_33700 [Devosia yakushimensis]